MVVLYIAISLALLPVVVKVGILYLAYIDWALKLPIICSVQLFRKHQPPPKKTPIGFAPSFNEELSTVATAKRKKE